MKTKKIIYTIYLLIVICLASCGTRKTNHQKEVTKEVSSVDVAVVDKSKVETTTDQNIKIIDSSKSDEITITPFDNTKEMVVEGKKYNNVILKRKKVNTNKVVEAKEKVNTIALNDVKTDIKAKTNKLKIVNVKETVKSGFNFANIVLWLAFFGIIVLLLYWRFYIRNKKDKINDVV